MPFPAFPRFHPFLLASVCRLAGVAMCLLGLSVSGAAHAGAIRVFAAASLGDVLTTLAADYQHTHPPQTITHAFAGSAALARQIAQGAKADLFISADVTWMDDLASRDLIQPASRRNLLGNSLVLVAPAGTGAPVDLSLPSPPLPPLEGRLCTGDPASVPLGRYARQALEHSGWTALAGRIAPAADARAALVFVEHGECPLGIVYGTDARVSTKVVTLGVFPPDRHDPIVYPGALLKGASADAAAFWAFLQTPAARTVFEQAGFRVLP